jgi:hypothetical protein
VNLCDEKKAKCKISHQIAIRPAQHKTQEEAGYALVMYIYSACNERRCLHRAGFNLVKQFRLALLP